MHKNKEKKMSQLNKRSKSLKHFTDLNNISLNTFSSCDFLMEFTEIPYLSRYNYRFILLLLLSFEI